MHLHHLSALVAVAGCMAQPVLGGVGNGTCKKTTVAILGGGVAGITAAQALTNASVHDFMILEYRDRIGGRAWHEPFGEDENGKPYMLEMGANWAQKYGLQTQYSDYDNVSTYNKDGYSDYTHLIDAYDDADEIAGQRAGEMLKDNIQDQTVRTGLALAGWSPKTNDMEALAAEWWRWDFEAAYKPLESSLVFGYAGGNATSSYFSDQDNFVIDQRGFYYIFKKEAATFLRENDPRLRLNTQVTNISYSDNGVTVYNKDGTCVQADYAICTFSLGVLQNDAVSFSPSLPEWKETSINGFALATYTKIFMQFNETFWPPETQYLLYADPFLRGWYPIWQSLSTPGFLPGSNIIFVTLTEELAWKAERQSDEQTKNEAMDVLRKMFPDTYIPEPTAFMYPRWSTEPWAYGSYSNWPPSTSLETHENLRANVGRLWFAGEATSPTFFGFLHGAWFEGRDAGRQIAAIMHNKCVNADSNRLKECGPRKHYDALHGTTPDSDYTMVNGWAIDTLED